MKYLLMLCLVICCVTTGASTYYVDYVSGSDASAGTATGTAWKHCPGDPNSTGTAASTSLAQNDIVNFNGGVTYSLVNTGIVASVGVTYQTNGAWGTGRAIITGQNYPNIWGIGHTVGLTNIVVNGLCFTNLGNTNALPADSGSTFAPNGLVPCAGYGVQTVFAKNILITRCVFTKLGYWQNFKPIGNASLEGDAVVITGGCDGVTITNCELSLMRNPIQIFGGGKPMANVTITKNYFHDNMEWAINVLATSTNDYRTNMTISYNVFTNTDQFYNSAGQWTGYGEGPHENAIFMYGLEGGGGNFGLDRAVGDTNVFIHHNYFINTTAFTGGSTCIWLEDSTSGDIYRNVFNNLHCNNACIQVTEPTTNTALHVGVYNNTVWGNSVLLTVGAGLGADTNFTWWWSPVVSGRLVDVANNALSSQGIGNNNFQDYKIYYNSNNFSQFTNNVRMDFNLYFSDQGWPQGVNTNFVLGGYVPAPSWTICIDEQQNTNGNGTITVDSRIFYKWDLHSLTNAPLFIGASTNNPATNNFQLQATSPLIGAATNLTALGLPDLNKDFIGLTAPASGNWDGSAFQFTNAVASTFQPAPFR